MIAKRSHLLAVVEGLLDKQGPSEIDEETILRRAGISRDELLALFEDVGELIEEACLQRFALQISYSGAQLKSVVDRCRSRAEYKAELAKITRETQARQRFHARAERAEIIVMSRSNLRLKAKLAQLQDQLTSIFEDSFIAAQQRGWINAGIPPRVGATFLQAYTLGRLVDDISASPIDDDAWCGFIDTMVDKVFFT